MSAPAPAPPAGAAARWDPRWAARGPRPGPPTPLIQEACAALPPGARVLELGAGHGRDALPLAARGLAVTAVDASAVALDQLAAQATARGLAVETVVAELGPTGAGATAVQQLLARGPWHAIVSANFHVAGLHAALRPGLVRTASGQGGLVVFVQPSRRNLERHPRPSARFLVDEAGLDAVAAGLQPQLRRLGWAPDGRHLAELVAVLPPG